METHPEPTGKNHWHQAGPGAFFLSWVHLPWPGKQSFSNSGGAALDSFCPSFLGVQRKAFPLDPGFFPFLPKPRGQPRNLGAGGEEVPRAHWPTGTNFLQSFGMEDYSRGSFTNFQPNWSRRWNQEAGKNSIQVPKKMGPPSGNLLLLGIGPLKFTIPPFQQFSSSFFPLG